MENPWLAQRVLDDVANRMMDAERLGIEVVLTVCSIWAAWKFISIPEMFKNFPIQTHLLSIFSANTDFWALFAVVGAALKCFGIHQCRTHGGSSMGLMCRCLGLAMSSILWCLLGASFLEAPLASVAAVPLLILGASAWWALIRFPFVMR